jgi:hypothetical protein
LVDVHDLEESADDVRRWLGFEGIRAFFLGGGPLQPCRREVEKLESVSAVSRLGIDSDSSDVDDRRRFRLCASASVSSMPAPSLPEPGPGTEGVRLRLD